MSVISAVACARGLMVAGAYAFAVENREYRELNGKEEKEFQFHMYGWGKPERNQEFTLLPWPRTDPEPAD